MPDKPQSFENHARLVPLYHVFVFAALTVNLYWSIRRLAKTPSMDAGVAALLALTLIVLAYYARAFALKVQDRVIRLEMRLRMKELLPAELQSRIREFAPGQLIALRFASDEELPDLAARVLRDGIKDKKTIKRLIRKWEGDHLRA